MRIALPLLAVAGLLGLGSCSWATEFFVVNASSHPLRLEYTARSIPIFPSPRFIARKDLKHFQPFSTTDPTVPANSSVIRMDSVLAYTMLIPADTAVQVFGAGTYTGDAEALASVFSGLRLNVETSH